MIRGFLIPRVQLPLATLFLALLAGCTPAPSPTSPGPATAPGSTIPDRWQPTFIDLTGNELHPADDSATKAIALVFILRDCPIANSYLPQLNRLHEEFHKQGVTLLLVHADPDTTADQARQHAADYQIQPLVILDPHHDWARTAGATISPEAAVFSPTGQLLYRGRIDDQYLALGKRRTTVTSHDLKDALAAILAGQPIPQPRTEAIGCPIPAVHAEK